MIENKKNSIWLSIQFIASLLFSLITLKLNFLQFGEDIFGIWILLISFWGITSIVDFGFGIAIVKYIAMANQNNDSKDINEVASTGLIIFLFLGIILLAVGLFSGYLIYFSNNRIIPENDTHNFVRVFFLLGISFYFQYLIIFFRSIFEGFNSFVITSKLTLANNSLILISVIINYILNLDIWTLALFYSISSLFLLFLYYLTLKLKLKNIKITLSKFRLSTAKMMFGFSFKIQIAALLGASLDPIIKFIIGNYSSTSVISYYEVARRFALAISGLFNTAFKTILPRTSILKTNEEYGKYILNEGIKFSKFGIVYSGAFYGIFSICILIIIHFWFGIEQSIIIFFLLSLAESVNNSGYMVYTFFTGIGKGIYLVIIQFSNIVLIIGSLVLGFIIFKDQIGLIGYFIAVSIMNLFMLHLLKRETGINISLYLKKIEISKLILLLFLISLVVLLNYIFSINIYILSSSLSVLCVLFFLKDIKTYLSQIIDVVKLLKVN